MIDRYTKTVLTEWRSLLEDAAFLADPDNSYRSPRKLMGVAVEIVPDHDLR